MDAQKLKHFREILEAQLRQHKNNALDNQEAAVEMRESDDGVKDTLDMSLADVNQELQLRLGERESNMIADTDQALRRIDEGVYGTCQRCSKPIPERRLEAMPAARYDAECQSLIEASEDEETPTL
ncbi:MAG: RNA polymerase-binding protein DksA [Pyrinomonadaceae bacterium]